MFTNIIFNPKVFSKFEMKIQCEYFENLFSLYKENTIMMQEAFNIGRILELIIKVYDNDSSIYCCDDHLIMLCDVKENCRVNQPPLLDKVYYLLCKYFIIIIYSLIN